MLRFLHLADIHLDSPLKGLEAHEEAPVEEIRGATRRAFVNSVELAIEEKIDFMLIVGDLYDGDWKDYNTGIFFAAQMGRLNRADIPVFIVSGNHDAANLITKTMPLPNNVKLFPADKPQTIKLEGLGVVIHGQSYSSRAVTENLAANYPETEPGYLNIGMLHTSLTGRDGHENYAPCTLEQLQSTGYDYWALGHVHKREILSESPWVVFPGNIQGRHIKESGPKGASLVTVEDGRISSVSALEFDVLRWANCQVNLTKCESMSSLYDIVRQSFEQELENAAYKPLAVRLILTGESPLHGLLLERTAELTEEFRGIGAGLGNIWLEKVVFHTSRVKKPGAAGLAEASGADTALSGLMQAIQQVELDGDTLFQLVPELVALKNKLPAGIYITHSLG